MRWREGRISPPQILILMTVRNEPKYGYEILKDLRELFDGAWEPKTGFLYPAIKKLQELGLLTSETRDDKEYYSLSDDGRNWLIDILPVLDAMSSFVTRFSAAVSRAMEDLGLQAASMEDVSDQSDDELQRMKEMRRNLESDLRSLDEIIEKMERDRWPS